MKDRLINEIKSAMAEVLNMEQMAKLNTTLIQCLHSMEVLEKEINTEKQNKANTKMLSMFISSKHVEGCSANTLKYYESTIECLFIDLQKDIKDITTNDLRLYLATYQNKKNSSKVTIDNIRRIFSSFFSWLEDEDYILKSPVRRIHKVRTNTLVKEVISDENLEILRDSCSEIRDLAMIDLLASTGMRVGELVKINRLDIDFHERECVVFGKGNKEREVYFNARTKIHLKRYLDSRTDNNPALFVSLSKPYNRLSISGVEIRLRKLGKKINIGKVHPHKFRRTLATMAIDKGMPIEQLQKILGHVKIDTTMHYAMVNQSNVKIAHRKFIS
jgi:site-specific recombinase XerD